jgi:hypothetical protein
MRDLDQLQRWMQTVIMHPEGVREGTASEEARRLIDVTPEGIEQVVTRSQALSGAERLAIYHRAYYARLLEVLRGELPVLRHALGEELFDQFAVAYLQKYPSRSYTLNHLGSSFPRYLAQTRPSEEGGSGPGWPDFLIDLVRLELTFNEVFDGPGVEGTPLLDGAQLRAISPERWPDARLAPVCCLRLLRLDFPVQRYFKAVRNKKRAVIPAPAPTYLAVSRRTYVVRHYELSRLQWVLLSALAAGRPVGKALALLADEAGPDLHGLSEQLWQWFHNWTAEGFFQAVQWPDGPAAST